jgi:hypothetical protein
MLNVCHFPGYLLIFFTIHGASAPMKGPARKTSAGLGFFNEGPMDGRAPGKCSDPEISCTGTNLLWFSPQANIDTGILTNADDEDEIKGMQPSVKQLSNFFRATGLPQQWNTGTDRIDRTGRIFRKLN